MSERKGGIIFLKVDGVQFSAKGNFTYNLGKPKREMIVGADGIHGHKELPQVGFIEGEITDNKDLSVEALMDMTDATVTLELANGKIIVAKNAAYCHEGTCETEEGKVPFRFEGEVEEVR